MQPAASTARDRAEEALPHAVASALAPIAESRAIGRMGGTWRIERGGERLIVKRMDASRPPALCRALFAALTAHEPPLSPCLRSAVSSSEGWYAVFEYAEGASVGAARAAQPSFGAQAADRLTQLASCQAPAGLPNVQHLWLERLTRFEFRDAVAQLLRDRLVRAAPAGPLTLTHGDVGPQNWLDAPSGLVLVDWAELGVAPEGFDTGWLAALSQLGVISAAARHELLARTIARGVEREAVRWYEGLGLLRLLYRTQTLPLEPRTRALLHAQARAAVLRYL